jgi:hypothetical protein
LDCLSFNLTLNVEESVMPLPTFLALVGVVILAAGLTVLGAQAAGVPMGLMGLAALGAGFTLRAILWR